MNNTFNSVIVAIAFLLIGCNVEANETFWLANIAAPYKTPKGIFPLLENPADNTGNVSAITLKNSKVIFNGELCNYGIEKVEAFSVDRTLADTVDDAGGKKKFQIFLHTKLKMKTDLANWKQEYTLKRSDQFLDISGCQLLQNSSMYRAGSDLILWNSMFFYRFQLGKEFKY